MIGVKKGKKVPKSKCTLDEIYDAIESEGSKAGAARKLGIDLRNMQRRLSKEGERNPGYSAHGYSTLRKFEDGDGTVILEWEKTSKDKQQQVDDLDELVKGLVADLKPIKAVKAPKYAPTELLNLLTISDYHLGSMSWHEETGADWDIKIAEELLTKWFGCAIDLAPKADVTVISLLGDFMHFSGIVPVTEKSHNILDADTRLGKLTQVAARVIRRVIDMTLKRYKHVHFVYTTGNHDESVSYLYRTMMNEIYRDEPRLTVEMSPSLYYAYEFGDTSLFFHHGHKRRGKNLDEVFVAKFSEIFGRTKHRYAHTGHLHSVKVEETSLLLLTQHPTLAAPDAYAAQGGWISKRSSSVTTYHKEHGKFIEYTITPEMVLK